MLRDNKRNLQWFEAGSMRELYDAIDAWQTSSRRRLLSLNIEKHDGGFCCIALTNPTEVIIVDGELDGGVEVRSNALCVLPPPVSSEVVVANESLKVMIVDGEADGGADVREGAVKMWTGQSLVEEPLIVRVEQAIGEPLSVRIVD